MPENAPKNEMILGFDPGRDKCGIAVMDTRKSLHVHEVIPATEAIATLQELYQTFQVQRIILGDQTTSTQWKTQLEQALPSSLPINLVDERYTTLEARDRYWAMYPPQGVGRLIPQRLRSIPRPIDDIVAILLIERYLAGRR